MKRSTIHNLFPFLLAASLIIELFSGITQFPNHINAIYSFLVLIFAFVVCPISHSFVASYFKWIWLPSLYIATFIVVSYYGVSFDYSRRYHVLYLPLSLITFSLWFMVGFFFDERIYLRYLYIAAGLFGMGSVIFALLGLIDIDQTRVIYGIDLPIAMPVTVLFGNFFWGAVIFFISWLSLKKIVVGCTTIGFLVSYTLKKFTKALEFPRLVKGRSILERIGFISGNRRILGATLVMAIVCVTITTDLASYFGSTYGRLFEGEDVIRLTMLFESLRLLEEYFPYGTGYYTFGYLTSDVIPYTTYTASGEILNEGVSLHNTFLHFMLEGGLPIVILVVLFYWKFIRILRKFMLFKPSRPLGITLLTWGLVSMAYGLFHQFHGTRYFFGIFAFAFGCFERYKLKYKLVNISSTQVTHRL